MPMHNPTTRSPFGSVTGAIPADNGAPHVPSQWHLQRQMAAADAKFEAARASALAARRRAEAEDRAASAAAFNRLAMREAHEANLVKMPRSSGYKTQ